MLTLNGIKQCRSDTTITVGIFFQQIISDTYSCFSDFVPIIVYSVLVTNPVSSALLGFCTAGCFLSVIVFTSAGSLYRNHLPLTPSHKMKRTMHAHSTLKGTTRHWILYKMALFTKPLVTTIPFFCLCLLLCPE